jgi:NAD(P)H dehydrogenase (quinone)
MLHAADEIVFISPVWWNSVPAMLKGFIDKVMKVGEGRGYTVSSKGILRGELGNICHTYVFTTSTAPTFYLRLFAGDGIKRLFMNNTLKQLGMKGRKWSNFGGITDSSSERRSKYLDKVSAMRFE